jgi:flavin-dependent dehydrogenase
VPGTLAVLPRRVLDDILYRAALAAGAVALPPARFEAPRLDADGRVDGATLTIAGAAHTIGCRWLVLATGAAPPAMIAAGMCERRAPSGVALRGYVHHPGLRSRLDTLQIVWHRRLAGGYGWIFPLPGDVYNVGAGYTGSYDARGGNLRTMFDAFGEVHPDARALLAGGTWVGELKGAPLRCSLTGARWSRPGLLATGEAIGSTYAFTGEGIGKAMETGLLAAEAIVAGGADDAVRERYATALQALKPRFDLYQKAEHVNRRPWLTDLVIWRAQRSPRILRRMSGVLEETQNPGRLLSWRGISKLMFE